MRERVETISLEGRPFPAEASTDIGADDAWQEHRTRQMGDSLWILGVCAMTGALVLVLLGVGRLVGVL